MERDLAHEADMAALRREQLRADISVEEANEECAELDELCGDPDEYNEEA